MKYDSHQLEIIAAEKKDDDDIRRSSFRPIIQRQSTSIHTYKQNFEESKDTYYNISMHSTAIFG
jgi:hypothetical protein